MRKFFISIFLFFIFLNSTSAQDYDRFFNDKACRIDFQFCGDNKTTTAWLDHLSEEPLWGGRRARLSTDLNLGQNRIQVFDSLSNQLIYTEGFSTLYFEWQTTPEALKVKKCFEQTVQIPYPKNTVRVQIDKRTGFGSWETLLTFHIDPNDKLIRRNHQPKAVVREIQKNTTPDKAVDIVVIAEGYTASEQEKFFSDATRLADQLFTHEPFIKHRNRINVYAVAAISEQSGISMPHKDKWLNTAVRSHYYTFYEPRYLTSPANYLIRDYAGLVPYDAIYVLANTPEYGGGGIYNFYAFASADSKRAQAEVVVHEFGHSFAGLGDEYFREGADVLDGMYNLKEEPWEPNITSLVNFDAKWKNMLPKGTSVPTPVTDKNKTGGIGVFEGGGYLTKGMYRPSYDCRMRTNEAREFCPVCQKAVEKVILHLTEK
ncbi:MAG: M64 family metallopeptidase [Paludibacter sp.]|nr:M64 family metallopeptidase [Paludibacter sp.]